MPDWGCRKVAFVLLVVNGKCIVLRCGSRRRRRAARASCENQKERGVPRGDDDGGVGARVTVVCKAGRVACYQERGIVV